MSVFYGHDGIVAAFREGLASDRLHHAWLLTGPPGVGKATFAGLAARRLLADAAGPPVEGEGLEVPGCHPIARLLKAESHPDFRLLDRLPKNPKDREGLRSDRSGSEELARSISVDQVRELARLFDATPFLSPWRVAIIDSIDDLEPPAANALLKSLEEPPPRCLFLLVSHAPAGLLPTIRSRCSTVRFNPLGAADMASALRAAVPDASDAEIAEMVASGEGSPGLALQRRGLGLAAIDADLRRLSDEGDPHTRIRSALASRLATKAAQPRYELFLGRVPRHIAARARERRGAALTDALRLWEQSRALGESALHLSLDPAMVTFELAGMVAALAPPRTEAARRPHG